MEYSYKLITNKVQRISDSLIDLFYIKIINTIMTNNFISSDWCGDCYLLVNALVCIIVLIFYVNMETFKWWPLWQNCLHRIRRSRVQFPVGQLWEMNISKLDPVWVFWVLPFRCYGTHKRSSLVWDQVNWCYRGTLIDCDCFL